MQIKLINIGFGSIVNANRLIAIVSSESAPIKRKIQEARESGMLVDATYGRKTRAVLIADSGHFIRDSAGNCGKPPQRQGTGHAGGRRGDTGG